MHPCEVCGGTDVNAAGQCARCGTYRRAPAAPAGPITSSDATHHPATHASGFEFPDPVAYPTPMSGSEHAGLTGGIPHAQPTSIGHPAYPTWDGYPPPGVTPAPAPTRSRGLIGGLIALAAVLALATAVVIVIAVRAGSKSDSTTVGAGSSPVPSALVDRCVVGTWRITSAPFTTKANVASGTVEVPINQLSDGFEWRFRSNGTMLVTYNGTASGAAAGATVELSVTGQETADFRTPDGKLQLSNQKVAGSVMMRVNGVTTSSYPLSPYLEGDNPYVCGGDSLTLQFGTSAMQLARSSSSA